MHDVGLRDNDLSVPAVTARQAQTQAGAACLISPHRSTNFSFA